MRNVLGVIVTLTALAGCATTTGTQAPVTAPTGPEKIESIDEFLAHQDYVRAGLQDGSLGEVSARELEMVIEKQDELRRILSTVDAVEELDDIQAIQVLNAQETINGILQRNLEDRPICRRETVLGSHRTRTVCMTPRQRAQLREDSRQSLQYLQRAPMPVRP